MYAKNTFTVLVTTTTTDYMVASRLLRGCRVFFLGADFTLKAENETLTCTQHVDTSWLMSLQNGTVLVIIAVNVMVASQLPLLCCLL